MRHKVGVVAVVCTAVFFYSTDKDEQPQSNNPWAAQAVAARAQADEPSYIDSAVDAGMEYLDEAGMNPVTHGEETVQRIDGAAAAMGDANNR